MQLNVKIDTLGKIQDISGFYRHLTSQLKSKNHALLESVADDSRDMLFSFIGIEPDFMIKVNQNKMKIYDVISETGDRIQEIYDAIHDPRSNYKHPFKDEVPFDLPAIDKLSKIFPITNSALPELFPRKIFSGGLLGYIGYDVVAPFVGYTPSSQIQRTFPDVLMGFYTTVLAYSHTTQTLYQVSNNFGFGKKEIDISKPFNQYKKKGDGLSVQYPDFDRGSFLQESTKFQSNTSHSKWADMIEETKEHINAGDIIQAVISRKMIASSKIDPFHIYQALKILNPSPYMYYLNFEKAHYGDVRIIGSSPEALVTKTQTTIETVPIAGTRRRGRNPQDELRMEQELLTSPKERAEHIMLVDLARNDLARVSLPGSVKTYELLKLKKFPNIMHLISKVRATSHYDSFKILKSMFPAGTVSGAPKKRAMDIIHELEQEDRGPYSGVVGYINFTGDMDMAISIRTLFNKNSKYYAQAGAGIVADSQPQEEYLETANKMKGILSTLKFAEEYMEA